MNEIKIFLFLLLPITLMSETLPTLDNEPIQNNPPLEKHSFTYLNSGPFIIPSISPHNWKGIDLGIGHRRIKGKHAWDINGGISFLFEQHECNGILPYLQNSYLFYPKGINGMFFGAGVTLIPLIPDYHGLFFLMNIPLTIGYQFQKKNHTQFFQFQLGGLNLSSTLTYGFGF